jgi:hypothetical protein
VWRAAIILATADGCGTAEIMRRSGESKPVGWRWQARFMAQGVEKLTRDKTRKPGKKPLSAATVQNVVGLALGPPPGKATHWTGRMVAKAAGVSLGSIQRILEANQLAPHRIRVFKPSSRASGSSAAYSSRSSTCNSPSTASSPIPTQTPNPSFGRPIQRVLAAVKRGKQTLESIAEGRRRLA